jgi:hypothetical protein
VNPDRSILIKSAESVLAACFGALDHETERA